MHGFILQQCLKTGLGCHHMEFITLADAIKNIAVRDYPIHQLQRFGLGHMALPTSLNHIRMGLVDHIGINALLIQPLANPNQQINIAS